MVFKASFSRSSNNISQFTNKIYITLNPKFVLYLLSRKVFPKTNLVNSVEFTQVYLTNLIFCYDSLGLTLATLLMGLHGWLRDSHQNLQLVIAFTILTIFIFSGEELQMFNPYLSEIVGVPKDQ